MNQPSGREYGHTFHSTAFHTEVTRGEHTTARPPTSCETIGDWTVWIYLNPHSLGIPKVLSDEQLAARWVEWFKRKERIREAPYTRFFPQVGLLLCPLAVPLLVHSNPNIPVLYLCHRCPDILTTSTTASPATEPGPCIGPRFLLHAKVAAVVGSLWTHVGFSH